MSKFLMPLVLALLLAALPARAALIYIAPAQQHAEVAETVSIDIFVSGLAGEIVSGWDINLLFDDSILAATDVIFDLANFTDDPVEDAIYDFSVAGGDISTFLLSFLSDTDLALKQSDPVRLMTISFLALTDGVSFVSFGTDPDFERNVVGRDGASLDLDARGACISVGQGQCAARVPAPATVWLLALALLLFINRRCRAG